MKTMNALGLACALVIAANGAAPVDRYNVVWTSPSTNHHGSMPLGNGDIALNAWVSADGDLHFYIGKTDAWDDNARLVKVGKVRVHFEPNPFAAGKAFRQELRLSEGRIEICAGDPRETQIRLWVDANHPVIQVTARSAVPLEATASIELWRTRRQELAELQVSDVMMNRKETDNTAAATIIEPDTLLSNQAGRIGWFHHNIKSVGPKMMAQIQGLTGFEQADPLLHRTFGAVITAAGGERVDDCRLRSPRSSLHRISVYVLTRHPSTPERWLADMADTIDRIEAQDFEARSAAHAAWWNDFWNRSWIRASANTESSSIVLSNRYSVRPGSDPGSGSRIVNGELAGDTAAAPLRDEADYVSRMYHLQRFITACAGRGAYPIKFNGSLFTVPPGGTEKDPDYRRWGPGYWWQNTRLPYISLCASGDFDLQRPLFRMYADELLPLCRHRTRRYLGHEGAFYPECIMFWGAIFSETYGWTPFEQRADKLQESGWHKWEWVGGLELAWMMLDYYEHTLDPAFLRQTAIPFAREVLVFFDQHYPTNAQGKLVMHPSQALETWWRCTNAAPELAGCIALTERLLALPAELAPASEREIWQRLQAKLPPLPVRLIDGRKALAPAEFFADKRNVENPELYALFPFRLFAFNRPNADWALTALEHRGDRGHSGWRQDDIFMAYLGLADDARKGVVSRARSYDRNERFPAFWGPNYDWTPDQDHGGVLMKAFQSMLMQADGQRVFLFPAWPKEWDVEFKLHAPQQTIVEGSYRSGRVAWLKVTPVARQADVQTVNP